ncbi:MAG: efflux RND transporter periplasmic adaptor subunit [Thermoanaerobaculia bacterium]
MKSWKMSMALVLMLGLSGCGPRVEAPPPAPEAEVSARVGRAVRGSAGDRLELAGRVEAEQVAAVSSRVMAVVTAVPASLGLAVKPGQTLVEIDPTAADGQLSQARGALAQAEAAAALARRNFERFEALAAKKAASELELDQARAALGQAEGAVAQARGAVATAASVAKESRVVAPFAGRVTAKLAEVGDLAVPGKPLVMLESSAGRRVVVSVPESLAAGLHLDDSVAVSLDARSGAGELAGRVAERSPGADPVTHSFLVKIALEGVDAPSGAAARAFLPLPERPLVWVPEAALIARGGLDLVVVRDDEGRARTRTVSLGRRLGEGRVEVLSGLEGGEQLLLGLESAPPSGARVREVAG